MGWVACCHRLALMAEAPADIDARPVDAFSSERRLAIVRLVDANGRVRVRSLSDQFGVSRQTIRKDLAVLVAQGRITRAHGGAISIESRSSEGAFDIRERMQRAEKAAIGAAAASRVTDGECIAIDASTTGLQLARALRSRGSWSHLTVVTNGLRIASELAGCRGSRSSSRVAGSAGRPCRWSGRSVPASSTGSTSRRHSSARPGSRSRRDSPMRPRRRPKSSGRWRVAHEVIAIVDHTKWGRSAFATFCGPRN